MKKVMLVTLVVLAFGMFAMAQIKATRRPTFWVPTSTTAVAAPPVTLRTAALAATASPPPTPHTGNIALWGQDVAPLFGKTMITGQSEHGSYTLTMPATWDRTDPVTANTMTCLSCHDGNYATGAMMKNTVYETVPSTYASNNIPTLLGQGRQQPGWRLPQRSPGGRSRPS